MKSVFKIVSVSSVEPGDLVLASEYSSDVTYIILEKTLMKFDTFINVKIKYITFWNKRYFIGESVYDNYGAFVHRGKVIKIKQWIY